MINFSTADQGTDASVARLVLKFALAGLLALVLLGIGVVVVVRVHAEAEAVRDARTLTRVLAVSVVEPALNDALIAGSRRSIARMDAVVQGRVLVSPVVRVKIWTPSGRIAYSDEHRLIGARYPLSADERAAFATGEIEAEVSELGERENRFERRFGKLLEVYMPLHTRQGTPLLFETYLRYSSVAARERRVLLDFLPALLVALVVLWIVQLPLAASLAGRLRARQREREELLVRAVEASNVERRRIAADLHDGAVQDLSGISYSLSAGADQLHTRSESELRDLLRQAARVTRETMRQLRSLLVEIYPPNLHHAGLGPALEDVVTPCRRRGLDVDLDTDGVGDLHPDLEQLVFRTVQEALRNVSDHAQAKRVRVAVWRDDGRIVTTVEDDGVGFAPAGSAGPREGHFGLALLRDRASDFGGELTIDSAPGRGTAIRLEVPEP